MLDGKLVQTETLSFDVATVAIKGARDYQEDSIIANFPLGQSTGFSVLADGMGGHNAGDVASGLVMAEAFAQLKLKESLLEGGALNIPTTLEEIAQSANSKVADHIEKDQETHGMGATLLATVIQGCQLYWVSVGDSPLFLFRDGALRQLNKDHSMAPQIDMMVKVGAMTEEMGRTHPDRNTLTSAISGESIALIDCPEAPFDLQAGDIVISASDGLQFLPNDLITKTIKLAQDGRSIDIANALLAALSHLDHPEQDNTAFAVVKLGTAAAQAPSADVDSAQVVAPADAVEVEVEAEAEVVADAEIEEDDARKVVVVTCDAMPKAEKPSVPAKAVGHVATTGPNPVVTVVASDETLAAPVEHDARRTIRVVKSTEPRVKSRPIVRSRDAAAPKIEVAQTTPVEDVIEEQEPERQAYWYRGQKYYKD